MSYHSNMVVLKQCCLIWLKNKQNSTFAKDVRLAMTLVRVSITFALVPFSDPYSIFECSEVFSTRTVHILLDCLKDTYDTNKQMAFDLLVACSSTIQPFAVRCVVKW